MATSSTAPAPGEPRKPQYHHFIPRFILRNYADPMQPPPGVNNKKQQRWIQSHSKEGMLNVIDLENVKVTQSPLSSTLGLLDMYRDIKSSDQYDVEKKLSILEGQAGTIISEIKNAFDIRAPDVWLTRAKPDILQKFLFIMKYRSQGFHQRFIPEIGDYVADDREEILTYMNEKGFAKPIDVWFNNLRTFIDVKMDAEQQWIRTIIDNASPGDTKWFFAHIQGSYLAFCQTSNLNYEFLLTGNTYAIFEGPHSEAFDPVTQKMVTRAYTEHHCFAPISPRLIIVLRSNLLPQGMQDDEDCYKEALQYTKSLHNDPASAGSTLLDLPVEKCRNSYSMVQNGTVVLTADYSLPPSQHKFLLRFFPIEEKHIMMINYIMLNEAFRVPTIVFRSQAAARLTIEGYLMEADRKLMVLTDVPGDKRRKYLADLEIIVQQYGGSVKYKYPVKSMTKDEDGAFRAVGEIFRKAMPAVDAPLTSLHKRLGGSPESLPKDMDQARKMMNFVIKVDDEVRLNRQELLTTLPPRRVWLFLKQIRNLGRSHDPEMDGPEDVIATASQLFKPNTLTRIMYHASQTQNLLVRNPDIGLIKKPTLDAEGHRRLSQEMHLVFQRIGSIRNCGIKKIEELSKMLYDQAKQLKVHEKPEYPSLFTEDQLLELAARSGVQELFVDILTGDLEDGALRDLKQLMFEILYPPVFGRSERTKGKMRAR
ncbi:hypothetical protein MMC18_008463 [Xylographa bjoerkii]|nr:hypothetical protein [Xylographa bjoerkii]